MLGDFWYDQNIGSYMVLTIHCDETLNFEYALTFHATLFEAFKCHWDYVRSLEVGGKLLPHCENPFFV